METRQSPLARCRSLLTTNPDEFTGWKRGVLKSFRFLYQVFQDFLDDNCLLRASALTYTSVLSLVPFLALTFALLKGLGVQNRLEPLILEQVTAGSQELVDKIVTYINNTNVGSLGAIGLITLIITVIALLGNIEEAFNVIWGVEETRPLARKFSDYLSVVISGPILLLAGLSMTTTLQSQAFVQWFIDNTVFGPAILIGFRLVPYLTIWVALIFLYIFIPNTKVKIGSALFGGVIAGTLWQGAQWGYIHFQVGVAKYNAIYGTLATLPIFLVWLYVSWLIVLLGVEVVYAHQNHRTFLRENHNLQVRFIDRERLALALSIALGRRFVAGQPGASTEELAQELDVPVRLVRECLKILAQRGLVVETAGELPRWQPGRDLAEVTIVDIIKTLRDHGESCGVGGRHSAQVEALVSSVERCIAASMEGLTLRDVVTGKETV